MEEECVFDWKYGCKQSKKKEGLVNTKAKRIDNIIRCSKLYNDDIHHKLQSQYDSNAELVLRVHKTCVDKYVHPKEVQKAMEHQQECGDAEPADVPPKEQDALNFPTSASYRTASSVEMTVQLKRIQKTHQDGDQPISVDKLNE